MQRLSTRQRRTIIDAIDESIAVGVNLGTAVVFRRALYIGTVINRRDQAVTPNEAYQRMPSIASAGTWRIDSGSTVSGTLK